MRGPLAGGTNAAPETLGDGHAESALAVSGVPVPGWIAVGVGSTGGAGSDCGSTLTVTGSGWAFTVEGSAVAAGSVAGAIMASRIPRVWGSAAAGWVSSLRSLGVSRWNGRMTHSLSTVSMAVVSSGVTSQSVSSGA